MKKTIDISAIERLGDKTRLESEKIIQTLDSCLREYSEARVSLAQSWADYYTIYLTTPAAKRSTITRASRHVGNVNNRWRNKIRSPKAYEIVETLTSYFMRAFFPNEKWFNIVPEEPIKSPYFRTIIELNRRFMDEKLRRASFIQKCRILMREMSIAGTAALMFPWVNDNVDFRVLSVFEFLLDPSSQDPNKANFIRNYRLKKVELEHYIESGVFSLATKGDVYDYMSRGTYDKAKIDLGLSDEITSLMGLTTNYERVSHEPTEFDVFEFWGDLYVDGVILKNVRATWTNDLLLNLDTNPYGRKPFIITTYLRLSQSPYGIGGIQPVASQLYYKDSLTSRHADTVTIGADPIIEVVQSGVINPDDVFIAPGKKIPVTERNTINPIQIPYNGATVQEMGLIEQSADRAIGTGPYIGVDRGRSGERVTAQEVSAQREAGGVRLSDVFTDLEQEFMLRFLNRFHYFLRKFYEGQDVIASEDGTYIGITPETIDYTMRVIPQGANNIADKEYNLRQLFDWMNVVAANEQMAQLVNWQAVLEELTYRMMPLSADKVLTQEEEPAPSLTPDAAIEEKADFIGGGALKKALQSQQIAGQLPQLTEQLIGNLGGQGNG